MKYVGHLYLPLHHNYCEVAISVYDQHIDCIKEAVFFGVILDENLNWKSEIIISCRK